MATTVIASLVIALQLEQLLYFYIESVLSNILDKFLYKPLKFIIKKYDISVIKCLKKKSTFKKLNFQFECFERKSIAHFSREQSTSVFQSQ